MEPLKSALQSLPLLVLSVAIDCRSSSRILGFKYSKLLTFTVFLIINFLAGQLNLYLHLAGDIGGNKFYYGLISFVLYLLLCRDCAVKKLFLTVLVICGFPLAFYLFLPFANYFWAQTANEFMIALKTLEFVNLLFYAAGMEYVGRRFQNLRRELPFDYTIYLTAVILFVHVAIYSAYDRILMINRGLLSLPTALLMTAFAASGIVIVIVAIFAVDRQVDIFLKEQLHMIQAEGFKSRELDWQKFSGFRHDIKNHLICLKNLLENQKTEQAISYMCNLTDTIKQFDSPVQTGNDYADALLSVKYAQAAAAGIAVSIEMAIPPQGFIDPVDLCCILSNALDNAIAACTRLEAGDKWITARGFIKQGQLVIVIKNSKPANVTVINGRVFPKETTADHGLGLDTVKAVVEKYGGILDLSADNDFSFSVLLPPLHL